MEVTSILTVRGSAADMSSTSNNHCDHDNDTKVGKKISTAYTGKKNGECSHRVSGNTGTSTTTGTNTHGVSIHDVDIKPPFPVVIHSAAYN